MLLYCYGVHIVEEFQLLPGSLFSICQLSIKILIYLMTKQEIE